jgi:hypothetical protein
MTDRLAGLFPDAPFELRFSLSGQSAVRLLAPRGPVAPRHAEGPTPPAPWSASARCGSAVGWLLAERPPVHARWAEEVVQRTVERHAALVLQRRAAHQGALAAELLERMTHGLRTDVVTLQAVAEGLMQGLVEPDELERLPGELAGVGAAAQRRLSAADEVGSALGRADVRSAEPVEETLRAEVEGAGLRVAVAGVAAERAMALVPGAGWAACARRLAAALAGDARLGGERAAIAVCPHPDGWAITAGSRDPSAAPVAWAESAVGELVVAGQIAAAAGGSASAVAGCTGRLEIELVVPAAPSGDAGS